MTTGDLARVFRYLKSKRPFEPYEITFKGGGRVEVRHPEVITQRDDVFFHFDRDGSYRIFSAADVSDIHVPPPPERPAPGL